VLIPPFDSGSVRLFTRNGYDISRRHQQIISELNRLSAGRFALDGELVVLDEDGRSNFAKLARGRTGTHLYAFDLLMLGDADLRTKPLEKRKVTLVRLLNGSCNAVRYCDHIIGRGKDFFDSVRELGLEGMVAKRRLSEYVGTLNGDWLKVKCLCVHDFVIGGWIEGAEKRMNALLLREFIDGELRYVGQVGSPLDSHVMRAVAKMLTPRTASPFADAVENADFKFCRARPPRSGRVHGLHG